jgi:hypothetical protein
MASRQVAPLHRLLGQSMCNADEINNWKLTIWQVKGAANTSEIKLHVLLQNTVLKIVASDLTKCQFHIRNCPFLSYLQNVQKSIYQHESQINSLKIEVINWFLQKHKHYSTLFGLKISNWTALYCSTTAKHLPLITSRFLWRILISSSLFSQCTSVLG